MIKFIHTADLHLDTPFSGLEQISKKLAEKLREAPYESFAGIVDRAIVEQVDFVLISGDLYNTRRVNVQAQNLFIDQLKRLEQAEIIVFLIRGNHDYLSEDDKALTLPLPKNVRTYSSDVSTHVMETKSKQRVAVSGFSYETQWVFDRKIKAYPNRQADVALHIGLLHGAADGTEANYAPFTLNELQNKHYDYWALGHIHQRQQLAKNIHYPGNIQGLHKNETGQKGCLLIEWTAHEQQVHFLPTAPIIWESLTVDISKVETIGELFDTLRREMDQLREKEEVLVTLTLTAKEAINEKLIDMIQEPDFNEQLTQQLKLPGIWIASVAFLLEEGSDRQTLQKRYPEIWKMVVKKAHEKHTFEEITEGVFNHIPSKYLNESNQDDYREQMIAKAIAKIHLK